jgi:hypothetical protein
MFEVSGAVALDVSSAGGAANTGILSLPPITPTTGSMLFGVACEVAGLSGALPQVNSLSPVWNTFSILGPGGNGQRMLFGHIFAYQGAGASIKPPPINNNGQGLFASGGIAYASFSIL